MQEVATGRCGHVALVLENCSDSRNASACLRTADLLGIQHIHVIESYNSFQADETVSKGAGRWLTLHHYSRATDCFEELHEQGYLVYASDLNDSAISIEDIEPLNGTASSQTLSSVSVQVPNGDSPPLASAEPQKVAVVFGNESRGISDIVRRSADACFVLPMSGFGQSFNLSVACSMTLYHLRMAGVITPSLSSQQSSELFAKWMMRDVPMSRQLLLKQGYDIVDF